MKAIVCRLSEVKPHPNADRLQITQNGKDLNYEEIVKIINYVFGEFGYNGI